MRSNYKANEAGVGRLLLVTGHPIPCDSAEGLEAPSYWQEFWFVQHGAVQVVSEKG